MKNEIRITTASSNSNINLNKEASGYYAYLAKQWAVSEKLVDAEDYSAKYYANKAKTLLNESIAAIRTQIEEELATVSNQVDIVTQKSEEINSANDLFQEDINTINSNLLLKADLVSVNSSLEEKANKDFSNCTKPYVVETYKNETSWYRMWSDGWCEQGGMVYANADAVGNIVLLQEYNDIGYSCLLTLESISTAMNNNSVGPVWIVSRTTSDFWWANDTWEGTLHWVACGYIKEEEEEEENGTGN